MNYATPAFGIKFDFSGRDIACFLFALSIHSLLLLWKGGLLNINEQPGGGLGDMLVNVDFRSDIPNFGEPAGGSAPKPKGIFARVKSLIKGEGAAPAEKVEPVKSAWSKTEDVFSQKKGFDGIVKKDALDISKGQTKEVVLTPSLGHFKKSEPNLKENTFKIARKDVPFKVITPQSRGELVNVNAIAVNVGSKTSPAIQSLDGGPGSGPALQSKSFAPSGSKSSGGFSGLASSGKSNSGSAGGGLATGGAVGTVGGSGGISGAGSGSGSGSGYGSGMGTGSGTSQGSGSGYGNGSGSGRSWSGGSGFGTGTGVSALPRNTVAESTVSKGSKSSYNSGFNITGALANRPIAQKVLASYEMDCRVSLRFRVDWSGRVLDGILVEVSSGNPTFDQKVIAALKQWQFNRLPADRTNEVQEGVVTFMFKGV
jgi:TonB family protein